MSGSKITISRCGTALTTGHQNRENSDTCFPRNFMQNLRTPPSTSRGDSLACLRSGCRRFAICCGLKLRAAGAHLLCLLVGHGGSAHHLFRDERTDNRAHDRRDRSENPVRHSVSVAFRIIDSAISRFEMVRQETNRGRLLPSVPAPLDMVEATKNPHRSLRVCGWSQVPQPNGAPTARLHALKESASDFSPRVGLTLWLCWLRVAVRSVPLVRSLTHSYASREVSSAGVIADFW